MFKKTTKTDKSVAITNRFNQIHTHVKNNNDLFAFLSNVRQPKYCVGGRSVASLLFPFINTDDPKSWKTFMVWSRFANIDIKCENYGVRMFFRDAASAKGVFEILSKIFKVSTASYSGGNKQYPLTMVIKCKKPQEGQTFKLDGGEKYQSIVDQIQKVREVLKTVNDNRSQLVNEYDTIRRGYETNLQRLAYNAREHEQNLQSLYREARKMGFDLQ
ncbi:hypothetical protein ZPAH1_orf00040 [Aeromonas phage ZPAH1]|nr:hypothetical protein ZPAH1_orf00040 [Aeromonas phage ZPAH1]